MSVLRPLGVAYCYRDLQRLLRSRAFELNTTFMALDEVSGTQSGYCAKLLGPNPNKNLGPMSFDALMPTLGVGLIVAEDLELAALMRERLPRRRRPQFLLKQEVAA